MKKTKRKCSIYKRKPNIISQLWNINLKYIREKLIHLLKEFIKALVIMIFTVICCFILRTFSPGNYEGSKLENYIKKNILKYIDTSNIQNQILYNETYNSLSDNRVIFVYSKYTTPENSHLGDEYYKKWGQYYDGVCISIFETGKRTLYNDIIGSNPKYKLMFCFNIEGSSMMYNFYNFECKDLDNDGISEFILYTYTNKATTQVNEITIFAKDNNQWRIISPDIRKIAKSIYELTGNGMCLDYGDKNYFSEFYDDKDTIYIGLEAFKVNDLVNKMTYDIIGVTGEGEICFTQNIINSAFCFLYGLKANCNNSKYNGYIYTVFQYKNKSLFIDPNWNMGQPLLFKKKMGKKKYYSYWGKQTDKSIFFSVPLDQEVIR